MQKNSFSFLFFSIFLLLSKCQMSPTSKAKEFFWVNSSHTEKIKTQFESVNVKAQQICIYSTAQKINSIGKNENQFDLGWLVPLVKYRYVFENIPSPKRSWLSTMNSYSLPGSKLVMVACMF